MRLEEASFSKGTGLWKQNAQGPAKYTQLISIVPLDYICVITHLTLQMLVPASLRQALHGMALCFTQKLMELNYSD